MHLLSYADQARRIGAMEFNGDGDAAKFMDVMDVPQECRVILATFFLSKNTSVSSIRVVLVRDHPRGVASASDLLVVRVMEVFEFEPVLVGDLLRVSVLDHVLVIVRLEARGDSYKQYTMEEVTHNVHCATYIIMGIVSKVHRDAIIVVSRGIFRGRLLMGQLK
ncbi:hypothetical protein L3X38_005406 [Prunus dulcis]|uniref:Uncharacterized protein n=1 Tax=Prunus dulcis TaxID=3755 RepID=A0AAD4ZQV8_PRUDU|nr:hypothetical protein L3X38_005406 [Prunus dulcis]